MIKEKKDNLLIFHEAELLTTHSMNDVCCEIVDEDITEDHYYLPENKYYMKNLPEQESTIQWNTENGHFWMTGKIARPTKLTITLAIPNTPEFEYFKTEYQLSMMNLLFSDIHESHKILC